jgi:opacity protein-like surface antigen
MWIRQILLLLALLVFASTAMAQPFRKPSYDYRSDNWEVSLIAAWQKGDSGTFEGGSYIDVDDSTGWGFSAGYNFNAFLNVGFRFTNIEPDYNALIIPENPDMPPIGLSHKMTKNAGYFTGTWNFFSSSFTPFFQLGAGWAKVDSNVPSSSPTTGCWWDPWWGWICATEWQTYSSTRFAWSYGLGARWDINDSWFTRAAWNRESTDNRAGKLDFDVVTLEFGAIF